MSQDLLEQVLADPSAAKLVYDKNIAYVSESCSIGYNSGEPDLTRAQIYAETDRILDRDIGLRTRSVLSPIGTR